MASRVKLGARGTVTIPKEVRSNLGVGEEFEVVRRPDGVIELRPSKERDPDQAWFWTERWQRMEREADEDIAAGRILRFEDGESFLKHLESIDAELGDG
jgi:antitoxin MazE